MAKLSRACALLVLSGGALLWTLPARAECGGQPQCIAVAFGDARPLHGTPETSPPLVFGTQPAGTAGPAQTFRIGAVTGPPGSRVTLDAIALTGANASDFRISASTCTLGTPSLLHDGAESAQLANTCQVSVTFHPAAVGSKTAAVQVRTAAITRTVPLTGTATPSATGPDAAAATLQTQVNTPASLELAPFITGTASGIAIVSAPAHGTAVVAGTRVTYTPARDYFGPDSFSYAAFNSAGSSRAATVSVTVGGRPDPSLDPTVVGLAAAQVDAARRFALTQIGHYQQRLDSGRDLAVRGSAAAPGAWVAGGWQFGARDAATGRARQRFESDGLTFGFDRRVRPDLLAGAGIGVARDHTDVGSAGSSSDSRGVSVALYGSWQPEGGRFVDGVLGFGRLRHDSERFVASVGQFARYEDRASRQWFGSLAAGQQLRRGPLALAPYARLDVTHDRFDAATETGAGLNALAYQGHSQRSVQLAAGVRASSRHPTRFGVALPRLRAEWRHAFQGGDAPALAYADQRAGTVYRLPGFDADRSSLRVGVGSDFALRNGWTLGLDYLLERADGGYRAHQVKAMLRTSFDAAPAPAAVDWPSGFDLPLRVEAGTTWDDNLTRGLAGAERLSDHVYSLNVTASGSMPLTTHTRVVFSGTVGGDKPSTFDGLGRTSVGVRAELQYKPSAAFGAPTFALFARSAHEDHHSELRTGERHALGLSVRQSWTDRIDGFAALSWHRRDAKHDVFDGKDWALRFNLDYAIGQAGTLYAGGEFRRGDFVSTGASATARYSGIASAWTADDAFGRPGLSAYRMEGRTVVWTLGWNLPLGARDSLDLSWRHARATPFIPATAGALYGAGGTPRYRVNQYSLAYLVRF